MKKKKIILYMLIINIILIMFGCVESTAITDDETPLEPHMGVYLLEAKTMNGVNVLDQLVFATLEINEHNVILSELDAYGLRTDSLDYQFVDTMLTVMIGLRQLNFMYNEEEESLIFDGFYNRKEVFMKYQKTEGFIKPSTQGHASFKEQLFGESLTENYYNYAPTVMMEGNSIMHVWFCGNGTSGNVTDYIVYRRGVLKGDGTWIFSDRELVLSSTQGTWDQRHVCDPTVIKGEFSYKGTEYNYLMSYLGCITNDSSRNEVGIAVAISVEGPWVKVDEINPIANYYTSSEYTNDQWTWGYGQPSLISADQKGKVLLFYTKGVLSGTFQYVELWDLSDLDNPTKLNEAPITNAGVVNQAGAMDVINNADFMYDPYQNRLYVVKEDFPYKDSGKTNWLTGANTILYINLNDQESYIGETLFSNQPLRWQLVESIGSEQTGFKRVHNAGFLRDEYGYMINPFQIGILYTRSDESIDHPNWSLGGQWPALHTYRLYGYLIEI